MTSPSTSHHRFLLVREEFTARLDKSSQEVAVPGFGGSSPGEPVFLHSCSGPSWSGNLGAAFSDLQSS